VEPTVTDANVVLGRIGARSFLGGEMPLDEAAARAGITGRLAKSLGLDATETAFGIIKIAVAKMALAVRGVSVQRGFDPRDFALMAMGGGGPLHAIEIARDLHIPRVIIPNLPAHFSALGMLLSDVRHDFVRTYYRDLMESDFAEIRALFAELRGTGAAALEQAGVEPGGRSFEHFMDLRYSGQEFHLQIPVEEAELAEGAADRIRQRFNETHERRFGHAAPEEPVELVNLRLTARGARPKIGFPALSASGKPRPIGTRPVYLEDPKRPVECPVYRREALGAGMRLDGPAIVEEFASTTVLFPGDHASVSETGELVIEVGQP
jgi:N-methylhydantoinase A